MQTAVSEDRLADLALDAAIEAEQRMQQPDLPGKALHTLSEALHRATGLNESSDTTCAYLSPSEVNVFSRALHESGKQVRSTADLIGELREMLRALDDPDLKRDEGTLQTIVTFCATLSSELSLRAASISRVRTPTNPYRR